MHAHACEITNVWGRALNSYKKRSNLVKIQNRLTPTVKHIETYAKSGVLKKENGDLEVFA